MLTVVTWKWTPRPGYRSTYAPETVNTLYGMVKRWYSDPFRFLCVTDDAAGIRPDVHIVTPWNDYADLPSPHGGRNPSCYRRLRMFHPEIGKVFGDRFVSLDLDTVMTGDLRPVWNRSEDIVLYGDTNPQPGSHYNGSMILLRAGARPKVWTEFDPVKSPPRAKEAGCWGSDQGWISYCLGGGEAKWGKDDGVYSFRNHLRMHTGLPQNARVVVMHGAVDPWNPKALAHYPWLNHHYREVAA